MLKEIRKLKKRHKMNVHLVHLDKDQCLQDLIEVFNYTRELNYQGNRLCNQKCRLQVCRIYNNSRI